MLPDNSTFPRQWTDQLELEQILSALRQKKIFSKVEWREISTLLSKLSDDDVKSRLVWMILYKSETKQSAFKQLLKKLFDCKYAKSVVMVPSENAGKAIFLNAYRHFAG